MTDSPRPACLDPEIIVPISRETTEAFKTGTWTPLRPRFAEKISPCRAACPVGNNISAAARAAAGDDFDAALAAFLQESPLPGVCGRICYHPCQRVCNRLESDDAVQIRALEQAAAEFGQAEPRMLSQAGRNRSVAVIGSGPAGLSCAYHLARMGHRVTIFEAAARAGGLLSQGIPGFRLPQEVLQRDLSRIWSLGVVLKTGVCIDPYQMKELARSHAAVFLAPGADAHSPLDVAGEDLEGVVAGIAFLRDRSLQVKAGNARVVVIGGGNTAIDAARTALRAGARQVTLLYRRTLKEMPAFEDEVTQAAAEGVRLEPLTTPVAFLGSRRLNGVRLVRMQPTEMEADGRNRPVPVAGSETDLACDLAVVAAGQRPGELFRGSDLQWEAGRLRVDEWNRTSGHGIFAGGDTTPARASVVDAMASGKRAALGIHLTVVGGLKDSVPKAVRLGDGTAFSITAFFERAENRQPLQVARPDRLTLCMLPRQLPYRVPETVEAAEGRGGAEPAKGKRREILRKEAQRCLVCGTCVGCNRCLVFCPEGAVLAPESPGGEYRYRDDFCKGCGVCASVCVRGVMEAGEDR